MEKKKVLICGAGSIGIFLGAKLHSKEHEVHLFGRRKLHATGEKKVIIDNKEYPLPELMFSAPKKEEYDFIFLTPKLYDLEKMIKIISKNKVKGKIISNIQNDIVDCSRFRKHLDNKKIVPVCVFGGFRIEKNKIFNNPTPLGWKTELSREGKEVSRLISSCGIKCRADKKFNSLRAEKMIVNCCLNSLSAIEKKPFNILFSKKQTRERIYRLFDECYGILSRFYPLEKKEKMKKNMFKNWHNVKHYSSTYQDLISGRKTEINFFNGYLIRLAKQQNLKVPENLKILKDFRNMKNGV